MNRSVAGVKLKENGVTGTEVKESSLRGLATAVNFKRVRFEKTVASGTTTSTVLTQGALRVALTCSAADSTWELRARSTNGDTGWDRGTVAGNAAISADSSADQFGGIFGTSSALLDISVVDGGKARRNVGSIVFNNNTTRETITLTYAIFASRSGSSLYCNLAGTAVRTTS